MNVRIEQEGPLPYLLRVPATADEAAPVLFFLHGYGEGAPLDLRHAMTLHGPLREGNPPALEAFMIVAPQMPTRGDLWWRYSDTVREILHGLSEKYGADRARAYLSGFSFGANGVLDLALLQPDTWAALWVVDPTRVPPRDPGRPVWVSAGDRARRNARELTEALGLEPPGASAGERVLLDQGEDHVGTATRAYQDERIYRWLLRWRLDS